jgi:hypothetical protein
MVKRSMWPRFGSLFNPVYMMINASILGNLKPPAECIGDNERLECATSEIYLAALGLGSSAMSIIILAPLNCFALGL